MFIGILCIVFLSPFGFGTANKLSDAAYCKPWKVPVYSDYPHHTLVPYFVEMQRCMGACKRASPHRCECVPRKTKYVTKTLFGTMGIKRKVMKDHIQCQESCLASFKKQCLDGKHTWSESNCACSCPRPPQGKPCHANQTWDSGKCQCVCRNHPSTCRKGKTWDKATCGCQCSLAAFAKCSNRQKATDLQTCRCVNNPPVVGQSATTNSNNSETKLVVALVVIGLLLGTLFIIDLVLMCSRKGFMYGLVTKCREKNENQTHTSEDKNVSDTGSVCVESDNLSEIKSNAERSNKSQLYPETCL